MRRLLEAIGIVYGHLGAALGLVLWLLFGWLVCAVVYLVTAARGALEVAAGEDEGAGQ